MKDKLTSSLFFIVLIYSASLLSISIGYAQKPMDSTFVYYTILLNPKDYSEVGRAFLFYEKKVEKHIQNNDLLDAAQGLRVIALSQKKLGYLYESEATATRALAYLEELPITDATKEVQLGLYNNLGHVYRRLKDSKNALYYYNKALELSRGAGDSLAIINNKATVHMDENNFELALTELLLVYKTGMKQNDSSNLATVLNNMGFVQSKLNNPSGLQNMLSALDTRLKLNNTRGIYSSYKHLSEYYMDRGNREQALTYAYKGYAVAKDIKSATFLENALATILKLKKDSLTEAYLHISDSISKARLLQDNKYAGIKFNFLKEQKRATQNELLKEKEKRNKLISQAIGIFVLLGSIFIYFILRASHRKGKIEEVYKTETRISKRIHDEVANDVYHVMSKLQSKNTVQEQVLDDLEAIYNRTRDISKELSMIDLDENFDAILSDLLLSYQNSDTTIITKNISKIDWDRISEIKKTMIYRVLQELMTNMKKHSRASLVAIVFSNVNHKLKIDYSDNGVGCDLKKQNGLLNTENRIETIKGTISFESHKNNGFKATILI